MDADMDLFDDLSSRPAAPRGRAGGKFQPRAKPRPTKGTSDSQVKETEKGSSLPVSTGEAGSLGFDSGSQDNALPASSHTSESRAGGELQPNAKMLPEKEASELESLSLPDPVKEQPAVQSFPDAEATVHVNPVDDTNRSVDPVGQSNIQVDSTGLPPDSFLDPFFGVIPRSAVSNARAGGKFQPRAKVQPRKGTSTAVASASLNLTVENSTTIAPTLSDNVESAEPDVGDNVPANPVTSPLATSKILGMDRSDGNMSYNVVSTNSPSSGGMAGDLVSRMGKSVGENADIVSGLEYIDEVIPQSTSGTEVPETGPEGKSNSHAKDSVNDLAHVEGNVASSDPFQDPQDYRDLDNSEHFCEDTFTSAMPEEQCENLPSDAVEGTGQPELAEATDVDGANAVHSQDVSVVSGKETSGGRKRKVSFATDPSRKPIQSSEAGEMNDGGKSSRQLRKRAPAPRLVDEPEDEDHDNGGTESPSSRVANDEDYDYEPVVDEGGDDDEHRGQSAPKKRASKKSKKPVADKERTVRKRKKANDAAEQTTQERPKKFSHSTRRNRRRVNKELLDMPEDEIDFQRLPIKDIILFAEHKERLAAKEAKTSNSTTQRTGNTSSHRDGSHNAEDTFASEQDDGYADKQTYNQQPTLTLFNHQSFMDKAPTGVRQFGTDLSLIQQLFPGRTRHEVKLKFKKEERQHPLRFREAQSHRSTDYSFFKKIIERLQEAGAEAGQESKRDGSTSAGDNEEAAFNAETNEEVAKSELDEDVAAEDQDPYETEVQDTVQSGEIDDDDDYDDDIWASYKT
ncbi:hypothetical protein Tsubulata_036050 [Turnera subulata]|uniref:Transcription factor TFIIIB component B'' Myb domain-containing protein n=1 Tax=Turnera subulata TaxID=218843 RepID=A0A9Q0JB83_9ROSI|nr:hypothetical protein Tsubulata_036050 [Turnera subulata]